VSNQDFKRAFAYATSALEVLRRASVPPYPHFYELLYTYATGTNPALNSRINAILRDGDSTEHMAERLYNEFLKSHDTNERLSGVSQRMSQRIDAMHHAIDAASTRTNAYSATLQMARGDLVSGMSEDQLKQLSGSLIEATRQMQRSNAALQRTLDTSRAEIWALQRDLDEVRRESLLDPLTKVYNRRAFDDGLLRAIDHAIETGKPLCLMLLDIDQFKRFNDMWGHQTGDQVLRLVAMTLKSNIKGKDTAARYGGEEFAAILPDTSLESGVKVADNVRRAIQAKELLRRSTNEKLGRVTASFGVAQFRAGDTPASLIDRADRCLYAGKGGGRNSVVGEHELTDEAPAA
jgi:diguanylate cyclase